MRSEEEAIKRASDCSVSARALVMRAQAASTLPTEAWSGFYAALDAAEKRATGDLGEKWKQTMQSLRRFRRVAISTAILVLVLAFFTLVPAGRAIAESIFNYVVTVFDKEVQIDQADEKALYEQRGYDVPEVLTQDQYAEYGYDEDGNLIMEKEPVNYDSIAAFEAAFGLDAFELESDQLTCAEVIETNNIFTGKSLRVIYQTQDGKQISTIEQWYKGDGQTITGDSEVLDHTVLGGRTMQYIIDGTDGSFDGVVLLDNSILRIYASAGVDLGFIWELLS